MSIPGLNTDKKSQIGLEFSVLTEIDGSKPHFFLAISIKPCLVSLACCSFAVQSSLFRKRFKRVCPLGPGEGILTTSPSAKCRKEWRKRSKTSVLSVKFNARPKTKPVTLWTHYVRFMGQILYDNVSVAAKTRHFEELFAIWVFALWTHNCRRFCMKTNGHG